MTLVTPETRERYSEPPMTLRVINQTDPEAFQEWLRLRQTFVEAQGWRYGDDADVYDEDEETLHIVSVDDSNQIAAGLRLTLRDEPEQTLSWSMLSSTMQEEAKGRLPADDPSAIWDLTRLVSGDIDKRAAVTAFFEMLGVGVALNQKLGSDNPRWYFTTTYPLFAFFRQQGIEFTPLTRGKISPSDTFDSVFCYADPVERTEWLQHAPERYQATYEAVSRGIDTVSRGNLT